MSLPSSTTPRSSQMQYPSAQFGHHKKKSLPLLALLNSSSSNSNPSLRCYFNLSLSSSPCVSSSSKKGLGTTSKSQNSHLQSIYFKREKSLAGGWCTEARVIIQEPKLILHLCFVWFPIGILPLKIILFEYCRALKYE